MKNVKMKGLKDGRDVTNLHIPENENLEGHQRHTTNGNTQGIYKFKGSTRIWKVPANRKNNKNWNLSNMDIRNPKDVKMQHLGNEQ